MLEMTANTNQGIVEHLCGCMGNMRFCEGLIIARYLSGSESVSKYLEGIKAK